MSTIGKAMNQTRSIKHIFFLFFRHGIVSLTCGSTEFILFILLFTNLKLALPIAYFVSFTVATVIGFLGHSLFTFEVGKLRQRNALFFVIQAFCALLLGYLIVSCLIHLGALPAIAKAFQLMIIFFFNVVFGKMVSFKKHAKTTNSEI